MSLSSARLRLGSRHCHLSSISCGDTIAHTIESEYILLLGYSIVHKGYNLTRFKHQKEDATHLIRNEEMLLVVLLSCRIVLVAGLRVCKS